MEVSGTIRGNESIFDVLHDQERLPAYQILHFIFLMSLFMRLFLFLILCIIFESFEYIEIYLIRLLIPICQFWILIYLEGVCNEFDKLIGFLFEFCKWKYRISYQLTIQQQKKHFCFLRNIHLPKWKMLVYDNVQNLPCLIKITLCLRKEKHRALMCRKFPHIPRISLWQRLFAISVDFRYLLCYENL